MREEWVSDDALYDADCALTTDAAIDGALVEENRFKLVDRLFLKLLGGGLGAPCEERGESEIDLESRFIELRVSSSSDKTRR